MRVIFFVFLLLVLAGLLLPHQFQTSQSAIYHDTTPKQFEQLNDLQYWSELMAWQHISGMQSIHISIPSNQPGAHAKLNHQLGNIELTIISQTLQTSQFSVLINNEHSATGVLRISHDNNQTTVSWQLSGVIHSSLFGGFAALYAQHYLTQMLISALNNLSTELKIRAQI